MAVPVESLGNNYFTNKTVNRSRPFQAESLLLNNTESSENLDDDTSSIDEPLDGANLLKRSLKNELEPDVVTTANLKEKKKPKHEMSEYFIPSKWDAVDPEEVEAQAMSTHEIYYMELENQLKKSVKVEDKDKEKKSFGDKWKDGKEKPKKSKERSRKRSRSKEYREYRSKRK